MARSCDLPAASVAAALLLGIAIFTPAAAEEPAVLVLGAGATGLVRHNSHVANTEAIYSLEYRSDREIIRWVKPLGGAFATDDGSAYLHFGGFHDFERSQRWLLTLHFSAGAYHHGSKNELGGSLQFQSGLDLFYRFDNGWRAGATLRHVSNAGTNDVNPGIETLALVIAAPLP